MSVAQVVVVRWNPPRWLTQSPALLETPKHLALTELLLSPETKIANLQMVPAKDHLEHMQLRPEQRSRVRTHWYESGHMYYIHKPSLVQFKKDMDAFFDWNPGQ